ncbi:MFS transporter [Streptomyces sp. NPDC047049]|uniref:MFS transporter n=1 Tax=Streptomyces sp. NPDC047049 TaxID=3156688 RepID=UPI0033E2B9AB
MRRGVRGGHGRILVERVRRPVLLALLLGAGGRSSLRCRRQVFAALLFTSVWLQSGLGLGPVRAGLALMPLALASFATSLIAGRTLHGRSPRLVVGAGLLLSGIGCALQSGLDATSTASSVALGLAVTGIGMGVMGPAMAGAVFAAVPADRGGMAAGAMTTFRQLGPTLCIAVYGVLFPTGSGTAPAEGLNRVYVAAAAVGLIGAALAYAFVPEPAPVPTG